MKNFEITLKMYKRGLKTLFGPNKLFTIDAKIHQGLAGKNKNLTKQQLDDLLGDYTLEIYKNCENALNDQNKVNKNAKKKVHELLQEMMLVKASVSIMKDNDKRYKEPGKTQYIYCSLPQYVQNYLKKIFISSIIYLENKTDIPVPEYITFEFNPNKKIAMIKDLCIYAPNNNPYYVYANSVALSLSIEAIGIKNLKNKEDKEKVEDFYNWDKISKWKKAKDFFEKDSKGKVIEKRDKSGMLAEYAIAGASGVYMLYDEKTDEFYVGTSIDLRGRILDHARNKKSEIIPNFTHYRYSVINKKYDEILFLIENSAIHDIAWIFGGKDGKLDSFKPSLSQITKNSLSDCKIVNRVARQRKVNKKVIKTKKH